MAQIYLFSTIQISSIPRHEDTAYIVYVYIIHFLTKLSLYLPFEIFYISLKRYFTSPRLLVLISSPSLLSILSIFTDLFYNFASTQLTLKDLSSIQVHTSYKLPNYIWTLLCSVKVHYSPNYKRKDYSPFLKLWSCLIISFHLWFGLLIKWKLNL